MSRHRIHKPPMEDEFSEELKSKDADITARWNQAGGHDESIERREKKIARHILSPMSENQDGQIDPEVPLDGTERMDVEQLKNSKLNVRRQKLAIHIDHAEDLLPLWRSELTALIQIEDEKVDAIKTNVRKVLNNNGWNFDDNHSTTRTPPIFYQTNAEYREAVHRRDSLSGTLRFGFESLNRAAREELEREIRAEQESLLGRHGLSVA